MTKFELKINIFKSEIPNPPCANVVINDTLAMMLTNDTEPSINSIGKSIIIYSN